MLHPLLHDVLSGFRPRPVSLCYCDYIADRIAGTLQVVDDELLLKSVGPVKSDLHPEGGYLVSTKKTVEVVDRGGRVYRITVEDLSDAAVQS